jgi:hypothetical protein
MKPRPPVFSRRTELGELDGEIAQADATFVETLVPDVPTAPETR